MKPKQIFHTVTLFLTAFKKLDPKTIFSSFWAQRNILNLNLEFPKLRTRKFRGDLTDLNYFIQFVSDFLDISGRTLPLDNTIKFHDTNMVLSNYISA